jgi:LuxR family transcriptional regulator, quorum-sensing system regulator SdiA
MTTVGNRTTVAALLHAVDERSPAGFAIGVHVRFSAPRYMFQSYPKRWLEHYSSAGLAVQDPTIRWGLTNVGWIRWHDLEAIDPDRVLDQARDFGIMNGVTMALVANGSRSIASFARADRDYETEEIEDLARIFEEIHHATESLERLTDADQAALKDLAIRLTH